MNDDDDILSIESMLTIVNAEYNPHYLEDIDYSHEYMCFLRERIQILKSLYSLLKAPDLILLNIIDEYDTEDINQAFRNLLISSFLN